MADFEVDIDHCLKVLEEGGIILYPTDTIWGIGCDATNPEAIEKIYALKDRPANKSMIILLADEKDLLEYVADPDPQVFELIKNSSKPTTIIFQNPLGVAQNILHEDGSIGIRIVRDKFCRHLLKRFRKPIVSTSANLTGDPSPGKFSEVLNHIRTGVDYVVSYRQDDETISEQSAIIKLNRDGTTTIIRE